MPEPEPRRPAARKRGNHLGFLFFELALRLLGMSHARRIAALVCLYYLFFDWPAVRRTLPYVRRIRPGAGAFRHLAFVYRLFVNQAWMLLDRAAFNCGLCAFDHTSTGYDTFADLAENHPNGVVLLGAHFGNWQLAVEGLRKLRCRVNLVMSPETNPAVKKHLKLNRPEENIAYIFTDGPDHGGFEIASALCAGEVVCLMGDRAFGADTVAVDFLGEPAYFPYSGWIIAAKTGSAVIPFFISKDPVHGYHVRGDAPVFPQFRRGEPVRDACAPLVASYAASLEREVRAHPEQCFIFCDVWQPGPGKKP